MRGAIVAAGLAVALGPLLRPPPLPAQEPTATGAVVDSIAVVGVRRNTRETVINTAGLPLGTPLFYRDIQRAIRELYGLGQFDDVQIYRSEDATGRAILTIAVRERPILVRSTVRGVEKLSERSVRERVELPNNRPLDPALVFRARQRIDSLYEAEGYYLARVEPRVDQSRGGDGSRKEALPHPSLAMDGEKAGSRGISGPPHCRRFPPPPPDSPPTYR